MAGFVAWRGTFGTEVTEGLGNSHEVEPNA
jgi:hypothetical protein